MKPLVMYHADCADGFGAAFAAWTALHDEAEYLPVRYGEDLPLEAVSGRTVHVLDFSFAKPAMSVLFEVAEKVVWLDHHKTAFEMWCGETERWMSDPIANKHHITLDNSKSGAYLAWEFFHPGAEVPRFIKHIDDYDRWQFKIEGTKEFNKALWSYAPWSFEQWAEWFYDCEAGFNHTYWDEFYAEGGAILRAHDQNVRGVVKNASRPCAIVPGGANGLAANCPPHLTSDVGHELATQSGTYGLCWYYPKEGLNAYCSLRSNGEFDVSAIAKMFGGGGHRNAAGFEINVVALLGWLL